MNDEKPVEPQSQLKSVLDGFHNRITALEAAVPQGLTEIAQVLVTHKNALNLVSRALIETLEGKRDGSALAELRKELEKSRTEEKRRKRTKREDVN